MILDEALNRIAKLEKENAKLKEEVEYYKKRKTSGRKKHNAKWMAIYNDFIVCYEGGMTMIEIASVTISVSEVSLFCENGCRTVTSIDKERIN